MFRKMRLFQGNSRRVAFIVCLSALLVCVSADFNRYVQNAEEKGGNALFDAVKNNDENTVRSLANLNTQDENGWTVLHWAADKGLDKIAEVLIDKGADLNEQDKDGYTPLHRATEKNHANTVQMMVEKDAELNLQNKDGRTALHVAAANGYDQIAKILIENNAELNIQDKAGYTPLIFAAYRNHENIARMLVDEGAGLNRKEHNGRTAVFLAAEKGHENIVRMLIENGVFVNQKDVNGYTALHEAIGKGYNTIAKMVIDKADVNIQNNNGETPLILAAQKNREQIVVWLLAKQARKEIRDAGFKTALDWAAFFGHWRIYNLLLYGILQFALPSMY